MNYMCFATVDKKRMELIKRKLVMLCLKGGWGGEFETITSHISGQWPAFTTLISSPCHRFFELKQNQP